MYRGADRVITLTSGARNDLIQNFAVPAEKVAAMSAHQVLKKRGRDDSQGLFGFARGIKKRWTALPG